MYRYFIIFIFLCATAIATEGQTFDRADSLRDAGHYRLAAVEYERCAYGAADRASRCEALRRKAQCLKADGQYVRAAETIGRYAGGYEDHCQQALCLLLGGRPAEAGQLLDQAALLDGRKGRELLLLKTLSLNEQGLYDSARATALQLVSLLKEEPSAVDSAYSEMPHMKSERVAWGLSLVPGLGHLYAGDYVQGAVAFGLNAALLGFGVWQVLEKCYLTAYLGGAGLLSITYPGTMRSAEQTVREENARRRADYNGQLREWLVGLLDGQD